ncbi:MAG: 2-amino-4-hydroxy-6-hydroxymethyldihydropteridine diphosphokinase [Hyphomicrobiaceae bacterium]
MSERPAIPATRFDAIVALGSNIGDKAGRIAAAVEALTAGGLVRVVQRSANYRTAPWGVTDQDWFVNAAVSVATDLPVYDLLARCQSIEQKLGRERTIKWGPRVIDLDILVYRDVTLNDPALILPHPHITARAFVLRPLADLAPNLILKGHTVTDWLTRVPHADVVRL